MNTKVELFFNGDHVDPYFYVTTKKLYSKYAKPRYAVREDSRIVRGLKADFANMTAVRRCRAIECERMFPSGGMKEWLPLSRLVPLNQSAVKMLRDAKKLYFAVV